MNWWVLLLAIVVVRAIAVASIIIVRDGNVECRVVVCRWLLLLLLPGWRYSRIHLLRLLTL
jgi:hypothetical protein